MPGIVSEAPASCALSHSLASLLVTTFEYRWDPMKMHQNRRLYSPYGVAGTDELWITGHMEIAYSDDRGASWEPQDVRRWPVAIAGSHDASVLWAVGTEGTILFSSNKGARWDLHDCPVDHGLKDVFVTADGDRAWAVASEGVILHVRRAPQ